MRRYLTLGMNVAAPSLLLRVMLGRLMGPKVVDTSAESLVPPHPFLSQLPLIRQELNARLWKTLLTSHRPRQAARRVPSSAAESHPTAPSTLSESSTVTEEGIAEPSTVSTTLQSLQRLHLVSSTESSTRTGAVKPAESLVMLDRLSNSRRTLDVHLAVSITIGNCVDLQSEDAVGLVLHRLLDEVADGERSVDFELLLHHTTLFGRELSIVRWDEGRNRSFEWAEDADDANAGICDDVGQRRGLREAK